MAGVVNVSPTILLQVTDSFEGFPKGPSHTLEELGSMEATGLTFPEVRYVLAGLDVPQ